MQGVREVNRHCSYLCSNSVERESQEVHKRVKRREETKPGTRE